MTNFEFWKDRLAEMARTAEGVTSGTIGVVNDKPVKKRPLFANYSCSECGKAGHQTNYCPYCGAEMDKED